MATNNAINQAGPRPMFNVYLSANTAAVTGDGTLVAAVPFDTVYINTYPGSFDIATFTYTAPATGNYMINVTVSMSSDGSPTWQYVELITTSKSFYLQTNIELGIFGSAGLMNQLVQMNTGDTMYVQYTAGGGTKTAIMQGLATAMVQTCISGYLID